MKHLPRASQSPSRAFSLVETLVVALLIGTLIGLVLPALAGVRESGRAVACTSNLRQLGAGWTMYASDFDGRAMPLAYTSSELIGSGDTVYWWGASGSISGVVDHLAGFMSPYLESGLSRASIYECPSQPWGSYQAQGAAQTITSTYGYNGYYLSPETTPGWNALIGHRPWRRLHEIVQPTSLLVFADTLLTGEIPKNNALLDPPQIYRGNGRWRENRAPTTAFRHQKDKAGMGRCAAVRADASVRTHHAMPQWLVDQDNAIGSIGVENDPWYVPDWRDW
ncbi:MAG: type II secretion system protein [Phycisphaeraceae bacterium]|nr:type II secretion system protein [Phycisphaeraceae bacterium]